MLPEAISNGLCSLKPEVDRLCMVCELQIDACGQVRRQQFCEAVMCSHARLTYNEVAEAIRARRQAGSSGPYATPTGFVKCICRVLMHFIIACVKRDVSVEQFDFETIETQIIFNADRKIETIEPIVRNDAHKIIEECMLCANVAAANFLNSQDRPVLFRVHAPPKAEKQKTCVSILTN